MLGTLLQMLRELRKLVQFMPRGTQALNQEAAASSGPPTASAGGNPAALTATATYPGNTYSPPGNAGNTNYAGNARATAPGNETGNDGNYQNNAAPGDYAPDTQTFYAHGTAGYVTSTSYGLT